MRISKTETVQGLDDQGGPETIFDIGKRIIYGDRERTYGDPGKNLRNIAEQWNLYLRQKYGVEAHIMDVDVCAMMRLMKEARLMNDPKHRDSLIDISGYAGVQDRINGGDK